MVSTRSPLVLADGVVRPVIKNIGTVAFFAQSQLFFPSGVIFKMECQLEANKKHCNCSYEPCSRKGICCECVAYHRSQQQLPACYFPDSIEKTYDRSVARFLLLHASKKK